MRKIHYLQYVQTDESVHIYNFTLKNFVNLNLWLIFLSFLFQSCYNCGGEIERGEQVVYAAKLSPDICWHPACFVCVTCEELLVDLTYCQHGHKLYCERHYAELIRPRCPACDEVC